MDVANLTENKTLVKQAPQVADSYIEGTEAWRQAGKHPQYLST